MKYGTKLKVLAVVGILVPQLLLSQVEDTASPTSISEYLRAGSGYGLGLKPLGFLDPSRMTFSHSYTMSYLSAGSEGVMRGLFMETIGYRLSDPVSLTLNLGYLHQPYSTYGPEGISKSGAFVGGAALTWRPRDNMFLHFEVANYPSSYGYGYYPYGRMMPGYSPFGMSPVDEQSNQDPIPSGE